MDLMEQPAIGLSSHSSEPGAGFGLLGPTHPVSLEIRPRKARLRAIPLDGVRSVGDWWRVG